MPNQRIAKTLRTGGTSAALDGEPGTSLTDGDLSWVHGSDFIIYPYFEKHSDGGAEIDPWKIAPDVSPGSIIHNLHTIYPIVRSSYDLYFKQEYLDKDIYFQVNDGGTPTTPLIIDGSASEIIFMGNMRFSSNKGIRTYFTNLSDDSTITLATDLAGFAFITFNSGEAHAFIAFATDGSFDIINEHGDIHDIDTDGYYCIYQNGTSIIAKNRTGSAKTINFLVMGAEY